MSTDKVNPYLKKDGERLLVTDEGVACLKQILTDPHGPVYMFKAEADPVMVAAAMARLSRRGSDLREIYLDEFAMAGPQGAGDLLKRVITGFGDDSVQQLVTVQLVVEGASNWLTKQLEWGRLASYLEQSTRYIYYDQKDERGEYRYYVPSSISGTIRNRYITAMNEIFSIYSQIVRELTDFVRLKNPLDAEWQDDKMERIAWVGATRAQACDAARPVLPTATKSTVGITASGQAVDNLIMHLLSLEMPEAREVGMAIHRQAVQVVPQFLERTMREDRGLASVAYRANNRSRMRSLAAELLVKTAPEPPEDAEVSLRRYWPEDERELVAEMLYEQAENLSLAQIRDQSSSWGAAQQEAVMRSYFGERLNRRHKPHRALELAHFEWEILADYGTFRDLQRHRMVDAFEWQRLTPHYGFEVPQLVVEGGLESSFRKCFELSHNLYGELHGSGFEEESQYATLLGHRMRYRFITNLRSLLHLIELRTGPQGHSGYRRICNTMYQHLSIVYPISARGMKFVNQGEDEALARIAAERATQYKLQQLGGYEV